MLNVAPKHLAHCFLAFCLFFASIFTPPAAAFEQDVSFPDIGSHAAVLMEFSRGQIIFSQNGSEPLYPASLTKIMTLLLCHEALSTGRVALEEEVVISEKAHQTGGSQMFLEAGQRVPFGVLLNGIATISANDACVAVAEHLYGSEALFVNEMNKKAAELDLENTRFQNTSGLHDPEHYSSAEDIARLSHYLISNFPEALQYHSQIEFTFNDITQNNRNPLLGRYTGADGLKTGHTTAAGYCLVATASQKGMRFITVTMNGKRNLERLKDTETMLNYAFRNYILQKAISAGEPAAAVEVSGGEERRVQLRAAESVEVVIPFDRQEELEVRIEAPESIEAPVEKETALGKVEVLLDGKVLQETPLLAASEVNRAGAVSLFFRSVKDFLAGLWQRITETIGDLLPGSS